MSELVLHGGKRSPFVRRVAVWLGLQGRAFKRRPIDIFGSDFELFRAYNPLSRVPVLSLGHGQHLIETSAIIDYLEDTAEPAERLIPASGEDRLVCQQRIALANALSEKGVAYVYETERRPADKQWKEWIERLEAQVRSGLEALESHLPAEGWMGGDKPDGSDVAALCAYDFLVGIAAFSDSDCPRLKALSERSAAIGAFSESHPAAQ
ncbi:glutathione S-transferase [Devosia pacifica]|uniref:Glutathione S-transferase n=1 Tax=Devosia pacifica TaxID=1335967 RepID=A0A918VVD2_9HYPH|nr:glutathione S-transferase family protein [Devosia pacifica]GHA26398.1 glutathione S-transferase [Devosia pacifica]